MSAYEINVVPTTNKKISIQPPAFAHGRWQSRTRRSRPRMPAPGLFASAPQSIRSAFLASRSAKARTPMSALPAAPREPGKLAFC